MRLTRSLGLVIPAALLAVATLSAQTYPKGNDPRDTLKPGLYDAGMAASGMGLVSFSRKPVEFDSAKGLTFINSDIAFRDHYVYQGNFSGFMIWDVKNPAKPVLVATVSCVTSQGDPSIIGNLLFISAEGGANRNDCAKGGVENPADHMTGVRIYDVSNPRAPKLVKNVQTCKGSHTHTVIPSRTDKGVVYIYASGSRDARPDTELAGCRNGTDPADETNSLYRLDVIKVPLAHPEQAEVVTGARIFTELEPAPSSAARREAQAARQARDTTMAAVIRTGPRNCHDVTAYPAMNLLAGACASYGLLVDISNPERAVRLDARADTNFSLWHTAVFSNDGKKVVFTDEWGGGTQPMCQATSMMEMGGNTILTVGSDRKFTQHSYFKIPSAQTAQENCVSHNGGLVPVPGRDLMVQGWYQGGVSVMDFTDPDHPFEIAWFDRGSADPPPSPGDTARAVSQMRGTIGGSWGAYWWNGYVYSSELARGLDILELLPTEQLSANELAAAKLVTMTGYNPQSQPRIEWPAAFPVVRSYLDQLIRNNGLSRERVAAISNTLAQAERQSGQARRRTLERLAREVDADVAGAPDAPRVRAMAEAIRALAAARR
jgi:hypothetical protein